MTTRPHGAATATGPAFLGAAIVGDTIEMIIQSFDPTMNDGRGGVVESTVTGVVTTHERVPAIPRPHIRLALDNGPVKNHGVNAHITIIRLA